MTSIGIETNAAKETNPTVRQTTPALQRFGHYFQRIGLPLMMGVVLIGLWEFLIYYHEVPVYIIPAPSAILNALITDWDTLSASLYVTWRITFFALAIALVAGFGVALLFSTSKTIENTFFPYAVILQVTPLVAIAPLIIIWADDMFTALLICATIIAFFPILSNTLAGLNSADHNLLDLFHLYRAKRWQTLFWMRLPSALPFFLTGLRISGGLALVGAVVAEFVAGAGGYGSGLAYRILEAGYLLQFPRLFAALILISLTGIVIHLITLTASWLCLHKWHESALSRER